MLLFNGFIFRIFRWTNKYLIFSILFSNIVVIDKYNHIKKISLGVSVILTSIKGSWDHEAWKCTTQDPFSTIYLPPSVSLCALDCLPEGSLCHLTSFYVTLIHTRDNLESTKQTFALILKRISFRGLAAGADTTRWPRRSWANWWEPWQPWDPEEVR